MNFSSCIAEEAADILSAIDFSPMQQAADMLGSDIDIRKHVMDIISGDIAFDKDYFTDIWNRYKSSFLDKTCKAVSTVLAHLIISIILSRLADAEKTASELIAGCIGLSLFVPIVSSSAECASNIYSSISSFTRNTVPIITSLSALGGGTSSAALLTPMANLAGDIMVNLIGNTGAIMISSAAICVCVDCICSQFSLAPLFAVIKRTVNVSAGLMLALFAGILKVQGMLGKSFDAAAVKTARFAVDKLVPAVGGGIADSMDAAISSILLIRSAVGVTGISIMAIYAVSALSDICTKLIGIRIAVAIARPAGESRLIIAAEQFADVLRIMLILCATTITIGLILIGSAAGAGGNLLG